MRPPRCGGQPWTGASRSASAGGTPAIIRPMASLVVLRGLASPMTIPSYMTAMRSEMAITSSRSSEMTRTAVPLSRWRTRRWRMYTDAATSMPRVGWATSSTRGEPDSSRAMMSFWMFPQEPPVRVRRVGAADQDQVLGDGEVADERVAHPFFRNVGQPGLADPARAQARDAGPGDLHPPAGDLAQSRDRLGQFPLPVAGHPGDADDLAGADLQRQPADRLGATVTDH